MNPHQKNKVDIKSLSPEEQRIFRLYGKMPSRSDHFAKHLKDRKYFDSGDYALSKAGKANSVDTGSVGSQHPVPENIPHLTSVPPTARINTDGIAASVSGSAVQSPVSPAGGGVSPAAALAAAAAAAAATNAPPAVQHAHLVRQPTHTRERSFNGATIPTMVKESSALRGQTSVEDLDKEETMQGEKQAGEEAATMQEPGDQVPAIQQIGNELPIRR